MHESVLVTGVGCPGAANIINALKGDFRVVGTDIRRDVIGRFLCDEFFEVPNAMSLGFRDAMEGIIEHENIKVVLPLITVELLEWASMKSTMVTLPILVPRVPTIALFSKKSLTYKMAKNLDIPVPEYMLMDDGVLCYKPNEGKGSRGYTEAVVPLDTLAMKYVEGTETSVDALCRSGRILSVYCRERTRLRGGLHYHHKVIYRPDLVEWATRIIEATTYDWFINIQFKGNVLLEVNPRTSTQIVTPHYNALQMALQLALGRRTEEQIINVMPPPPGTKSFYYHNQFTFTP